MTALHPHLAMLSSPFYSLLMSAHPRRQPSPSLGRDSRSARAGTAGGGVPTVHEFLTPARLVLGGSRRGRLPRRRAGHIPHRSVSPQLH